MDETNTLDKTLEELVDEPETKSAPTSVRVYVGNLSYETKWTTLKDHMRQAGPVVFAEILEGGDGRSKGCGVVEYQTPEFAKIAIETLNDSVLDDRLIFVREDRENKKPVPRGGYSNRGHFQGPPRGRGGYRGGRGGFAPQFPGARGGHSGYPAPYNNAPKPPPTRPDDAGRKLYVSNLPYSTRWQDLKDIFNGVAGGIIRADVLLYPDGRSKGSGVVIYETKEAAQTAIEQLNGCEIEGRQISVREDRYV